MTGWAAEARVAETAVTLAHFATTAAAPAVSKALAGVNWLGQQSSDLSLLPTCSDFEER